MTEREFMQVATLIVSIAGVVAWLRLVSVRRYYYIAIPVLGWLFHIVVFYAAILFVFTPESGMTHYGSWSAVLRLHGAIVALSTAIGMRVLLGRHAWK
jgi:uncharacterized membrane protein